MKKTRKKKRKKEGKEEWPQRMTWVVPGMMAAPV